MKIGIIDADLLCRKKHRFPNLACMKISSYHKQQGHDVTLLLSWEDLTDYDKVFVSKVFTDTKIPDGVLHHSNVEFGGTGFYFERAPALPDEIEHCMPDYHLYDDFVDSKIQSGARKTEFKFFLDYSIGFLTRGCFRKCGFCVNQKYDRVSLHSPLSEFYDPSRPKICLLDDNFLGYPGWRDLLREIQETGRSFRFNQGLDERLLTDEKCELLFQSRYDRDVTFAFDSIKDYALIEQKLKLIRKYTSRQIRFYVLCAFESQDERDIRDLFARIELLMRYQCIPYVMRYELWQRSPYKGLYATIARWCNQPNFIRKKSFREFVFDTPGQNKSAPKYALDFERQHPEIATKYFDMKWSDFNEPRNRPAK